MAFDSEAKAPVAIDDLRDIKPESLRLGVQPYVTLLELDWPLDDFSIALKKRKVRGEASNAVDTAIPRTAERRVALPKREHVYVAVHRWENSIYYKRLEVGGYRILTALRDGRTIAEACVAAISADPDPAIKWESRIKAWFENWTRVAWLYKRT